MRRPVKPFVTEYRGAARRQPVGLSLKLDDEPTAPPSRQTESFHFVGSSQPSEDSYEAALRAADALFSGAAVSKSPVAPAFKSTALSADRDPWAAPAAPAPTAPTPSGSGRILRVIDEAPAQALVDLEIERAPKRRGRKPGSKNKPKLEAAKVALFADTTARPSFPVPAPETVARMAAMNVTVKRPISAPAPVRATPQSASEKPRVERYAWVRTKLKPGEKWKRHLPKVAW